MIDVIYEHEDGILSTTTLTQDFLQVWHDKPWSLRAIRSPAEEPLSAKAVSIPVGSTWTDVIQAHCRQIPNHQDDGDAGTLNSMSSSIINSVLPPTDSAIYDMDRSWLMQLQCDWREHAQEEYVGEGRLLQVQTWYLHHDAAPRCQYPRRVTLDRMDHLWLQDLRAAWADTIRNGEVLHLVYVAPQPPRADDAPFAPHIILTQGVQPDRIGAIFTARFIQEHRTQLMQEAISTQPWMCGTRAIDLLRIPHRVEGCRWLARSGIMQFLPDELEEIPEGISIVVDIRRHFEDEDTDEVNLAAWNRQNYPPDQPVLDLPHAVRQLDQHDTDDESSSSGDGLPPAQARDWRFAHVYRTQRRVYHGHLPWDHASIFHSRVSHMTGVAEDDIVYCHHVEHAPADLKAAHTEALLLHSVVDLPLGSVRRLILVDIEFHEHWPALDVSTSRRCLALPHQVQRRSLLRLLGVATYCERVRSRCLVWVNHEAVSLRSTGSFFLEHGDYLRVAIPPWPQASALTSTRQCVSTIRQHGRLRILRTPLVSAEHEVGMTDVDEFERQLYPQRLRALSSAAPQDDDAHVQLQLSLQRQTVPLPTRASDMLTSEMASLCTAFASACEPPCAKIEDEPIERVQQARQHAAQTNRATQMLDAFPPFIQELHQLLFMHQQQLDAQDPPHLLIDTWYSDHVRRPHSGLGRLVHLSADFTSWYAAIVFAWEDLVDPFRSLTCHIVHPTPEGGDPDAMVHIVLVQNAQPNLWSTLVSIADTADDPWHPRLMCLAVPSHRTHAALQELVDLDHVCQQAPDRNWCRSWYGDREITHDHDVAVMHGSALSFYLQRDVPQPFLNEEDDTPAEEMHLLQYQATARRTLHLDPLIAAPSAPVWVHVACQKVIFLRNQLLSWEAMPIVLQTDQVDWHPSTSAALKLTPLWTGETPLGFTFYTDGSAQRRHDQAAAAVVLLVTTQSGVYWGGYVTAPGLGAPTAPRAEATALLLAFRWLRQLLSVHQSFWVEFAFDCMSVAGIAQGTLGSTANQDLFVFLRALLHWIEPQCSVPITWTHLRSHQGDPWNEAADTLCAHALRHGPTIMDLAMYHAQCTFDQADLHPIQWLWLLDQSLVLHPEAPLLDGLDWKINIATPLTSVPDLSLQPAMLRRDVQPQGPREEKRLALQLGSANVLTLFPGQASGAAFFSARAEGLARQFADQDLHFIGLQETRSKLEGHARLHDFHVLSSSATQRGIGGIQLWVRRQIRYEDTILHVDHGHLRILHAGSQRLLVRFSCGGLRLLLLVLHAPDVEDELALQAFWNATTAAIPSRYRSWTLLVMADANSRLGEVVSDAVDSFQADPENVKGAYFHRWMLDHALYAPQTFLQCHTGQGRTWTHSSGAQARLDYIVVPQELDASQVCTWIAEDIDLSIQKEDHACVRATVTIPFHATHPPAKVDTSLPFPCTSSTWNLDVHTHAATLQCRLRQFQRPERVLRKQHLTDDTDDKDFYEGLAIQAGQASSSGACRLWAALKPVLPRWRQKQRSNLRCLGPTVADKLEHYSNLEAGHEVSYPELLDHCVHHQRHALHEAPLTVPLCDLPSRTLVETLLARLKIAKAPGLDELRPGTLKRHALDISPEITKLFMKMWTTGAEPVQFKGGLVHTIGKKKRSNDIRHMRGIAFLDVMGKLSHAVLRSQFMPALSRARAPLQLGGFAHQSTVFATHYLRACTHHAKQHQVSSCIIFLDVRSAFHAMLREAVFSMGDTLHPCLQALLCEQGCDLAAIRERCDGSVFGDVPLATARLLADAHTHTWFTVASTDLIRQTERGSRPGSPLADAAYNGLMTRLIRDLQAALDVHPLLVAARQRLSLSFPMVAWVDDLAIPIMTENAIDLAPTASWALEQAIQICRSYGLSLNLQPTKTEAVITFRGPGATECRTKWCGEHHGHIPCPTEPVYLRCVPQYEHLGTIFQANAAIDAEL
eukprot:s432_g13.t1